MVSHEDNMEMVHFMCKREAEQLMHNLTHYLLESERVKKFIINYGEDKNNVVGSNIKGYALAVYDNYMSNLEMVIDLARKFNIHLQLKPLSKTITNVTNYETPQRSFTDFLQWTNFRQEHSNAYNMRFTAAGDACSASSVNIRSRPSSLLRTGQPSISLSSPTLSPPASPLSPKAKRDCGNLIKVNEEQQNKTEGESTLRKVHFPSKLEQYYEHKLKPRDLTYFTKDREFTATITYVENYEKLIFYICYIDDPELLELSNMLHLHRLLQPPTNHNEIFGISMGNDSILRAVVHRKSSCDNVNLSKAVNDSKRLIDVLLVDFGEVVSLDDSFILYEVPIKFQNIPTQAIKCHLLGIKEGEANKEQENLIDILRHHEFHKCNFRVVHNSGEALQLLLILQYEEGNNHTPEWLSMMTAVNERVNNLNPFMFSSEDEDDFKDYEEKNEIFNSPLTLTPPRMCSTGTEHIVAGCTQESNALLNDGILTNCNSIVSANSVVSTEKDDISTDDKNLILTATYVADVEYFYAQIEKNRQESLEALIWSDDEVPVSHRLVEAPKLHDLILAKYNKDDFWYRAKVLEIYDQNKFFKVFYVDYGNKEMVSIESMAKCLCAETEEPYRAVRCHIANICSITGSDVIRHQQALNTLCLLILNQTFEVKVLHKSESELLIQIITEEFSEVVKTLVRLGYAKEIENQKMSPSDFNSKV